MRACCLDASVALNLVLKGEPYRNRARQLLRDCLVGNIPLIAPALFQCEVDSVIQKRVMDGALTAAEATKALAGLDKIPIRIVAHENLRHLARSIAAQFHQRTVYDSTYAALANLYDGEYWTADKAFYDAVKADVPFVKYLPDYGVPIS